MQCPGCDYTVIGRESGFPSFTHCCQACQLAPGEHGPRCVRHRSPYAERPRLCPGCKLFAVTGVHHTHCCYVCSQGPSEGERHGPRCHRRPFLPAVAKEPPGQQLPKNGALVTEGVADCGNATPPTTDSPASSPSPEEVDLDRCAYVVLLFGSDVEYALGALIVAWGLRRVGAQAKKLLLHASNVPEKHLDILRRFYDETRPIWDPVRVPRDSPLCPHSRDFAHLQFLKLHVLELEFDKVLYLDCDLLVRRNLDHLFALPAPAAMERILPIPPHGARLPNRVYYCRKRIRGIQGGVMLLQPDKALFAELRAEVEDASKLRSLGYVPSVGNEQDYLTWRYCKGLESEFEHDGVWTHLGCEYNYEVHTESNYFAVGRERWLWLDYEREAAVLHFSAPSRKRAKFLLSHDIAEVAAQKACQDPRIAFASRVWDEEVARLDAALKIQGVELSDWIGGCCPDRHKAIFAVMNLEGALGMAIKRVEGDARAQTGVNNWIFTFEAYTCNCKIGLRSFPPCWTPGPPWGESFWAQPVPRPPPVPAPSVSPADGTDGDGSKTPEREDGVKAGANGAVSEHDLASNGAYDAVNDAVVAVGCGNADGVARTNQSDAVPAAAADENAAAKVNAWLLRGSKAAGGRATRWAFGLLDAPPPLPPEAELLPNERSTPAVVQPVRDVEGPEENTSLEVVAAGEQAAQWVLHASFLTRIVQAPAVAAFVRPTQELAPPGGQVVVGSAADFGKKAAVAEDGFAPVVAAGDRSVMPGANGAQGSSPGKRPRLN